MSLPTHLRPSVYFAAIEKASSYWLFSIFLSDCCNNWWLFLLFSFLCLAFYHIFQALCDFWFYRNKTPYIFTFNKTICQSLFNFISSLCNSIYQSHFLTIFIQEIWLGFLQLSSSCWFIVLVHVKIVGLYFILLCLFICSVWILVVFF